MKLTTGKVKTIVEEEVRMQYLVFQITPPNATLEVDDKIWEVEADGSAMKFVNFGTYTYRVQAKDYHTEVGKVVVDNIDTTIIVNVTLKPNFGRIEVDGLIDGASVYVDNKYVGKTPWKNEAIKSGEYTVKVVKEMYDTYTETVTVEDNKTTPVFAWMNKNFVNVLLMVDADAEIWVNNEMKGVGSWVGTLTCGTYKIECKQANHETSVITQEITIGMDETINLPKPRPICGSLNVESTPNFAVLFIDGEEVGETPRFIPEILVGEHELRLEKEDYVDYTETITINKKEKTHLKINMKSLLENTIVEILDNKEMSQIEKYKEIGFECDLKNNYVEALKYYKMAAELGDDQAQYIVAQMYEDGEGVEQSYSEAAKWYRMAAEQGHALSQVFLGILYENGEGVEQNYSEAVKWFRKAANQGDAGGQNLLGYMYSHGNGVEQNYSEAVKWYRKAAEKGWPSGQFNLGYMYEFGLGTEKNLNEAIKWYRKAADQGSADAQFSLGELYENGHGVSRDISEAKKWYRKAAERGDEDAIEALERLK